jgi:hypothetical protein
MRFRILLIVTLCGAPTALLSQTASTSSNLPPGFIDGSKNPNQIPDAAAYRLVFLSLTVPPSADSKALAKQSALMAQFGFSGADQTAMTSTMTAFL